MDAKTLITNSVNAFFLPNVIEEKTVLNETIINGVKVWVALLWMDNGGIFTATLHETDMATVWTAIHGGKTHRSSAIWGGPVAVKGGN